MPADGNSCGPHRRGALRPQNQGGPSEHGASESAGVPSPAGSSMILGLLRDFPPPNAASLREIGKSLRPRSEAPSQAKPQVAADESGCTPGSVARSPRGGRGDGHPSRVDVAVGLVRSTHGLGRAALERPRRNTWVFPFDLAPGGVYLAAQVALGTGGLLHRRFTLTEDRSPRRFVFCGTFPRVTPGGR